MSKITFSKLVACFLFPLILPIAIILLIITFFDIRGNPIFAQQRVGYKGKPIRILKIRTFNIQHNTISKFGKIIRPSGLDEILQVLSILKGDMIWFGPRPRIAEVLNEEYVK